MRRDLALFGDFAGDQPRMSAIRQYVAAVDAGYPVRHATVRSLIADLTDRSREVPLVAAAAVVFAGMLTLMLAAPVDSILPARALTEGQWLLGGGALWLGLAAALNLWAQRALRAQAARRAAFAHQHLAAELPGYIDSSPRAGQW